MSESSTVVGFRSTREVLCGLVRPLYLPSAVYSVGVGAAIPAQVTVGLDVGLTASVVALLVACSGAAMIAGTWWAGTVVERFGERSALAGATALAVLSVVGLGVTLWTTSGGAVVAYVVALFGFNLSDGVWGVARQELMAQWVPPDARGRAVNTYGASQRVGRLFGPFLGAGLIVLVGPVGGFYVFALGAVAGCVVLLTAPVPPGVAPVAPASSRGGRMPSGVWRALWIVGLGVLALNVVRSHQEVLLPLWAAEEAGLDPARVSMAIGVSMALELVLFYPAGWVLDRYGVLPVLCTCLLALSGGFALLLVPGAFWPAAVVIGLGGGIGSGIVKTTGLQLAPEVGRPRFLGRWSALASAGVVVGPLMVAVAGRWSLGSAVAVSVTVGVVGAAWLATTSRELLRR